MKRSLAFSLGAILLSCATGTPTASAATETQKLTALQSGLDHLVATQQAGGYWNYGGYEQAATGAAASAFLGLKDKWDAGRVAQYQAVVDKAMAYLLNSASTATVSTRNDGVNICPSGTGGCTGVFWNGNGEATYTTGLIVPAIAEYGVIAGRDVVATNGGPLAGMTWRQIAQGITNEFAASQSSGINGNRDGGWRYYIPGNGDSDSSTTQWAVVSLIYDETLGATTPQTVKDHLKIWLSVVQNSSGAICYQPGVLPCDHADTGGWLLAMEFVGYDVASSVPMQNAVSFLNTHWQDTANNTWYGNFGQPYAMWGVYKGLETTIGLKDQTHITNLASTCGMPANPPLSGVCNWYEDYNQWLVTNQMGNGSWAGYSSWFDPLSTAFNVSILGPTLVPIDMTPPTISGMPGPGCSLWPPSHKLVTVATISASTTGSSGIASFEVVATSNEPENPGPDIVITGSGLEPRAVQLRGERLGTGLGRVYTITATTTNGAGITTTATATCTVPHDQGH